VPNNVSYRNDWRSSSSSSQWHHDLIAGPALANHSPFAPKLNYMIGYFFMHDGYNISCVITIETAFVQKNRVENFG
jgi:hypothetical protein